MLRLQYSRQLTRLYKNIKKTIFPRLLDIIVGYQNKYGTIHKMKTIRSMGITADIDHWLEIELTREILEPSQTIIIRNIREAYRRGLVKSSHDIKSLMDIDIAGGITPRDWDALILLQDISFNRIRDCTLEMKNAITYSCSRGIMEGWGINKIAYEIRHNLDGNSRMGIARAKTIARTEIIDAYNTAAEDRYKQAGLSDKEIVWITSFDERTCPVCSGYDGMTLAQTGERPPVHPNCRCSLAPNPK